MKCQRCNNFMVEEKIVLSMDESKTRSMSAWHCIYCGRVEYRTDEIVETVLPSSNKS
jgi:hypothetical protein